MIRKFFNKREPAIDGILVTVGLCIIALLLCVALKESMMIFINQVIASITQKATQILNG